MLKLQQACQLLGKLHITSIFKRIDNFFFDCDGVLWNGNNAIPGNKEVITKLKQLGKRVFLISNNSSKSRKQYVEKCVDMGLPMAEDEIVCTSYVSALYLHNIGFKGKVYLMGNKNIASELDSFGIQYTGLGPDPLVTDVSKTILDPDVNCVLVGFDTDISYMKVLKAASYAKRAGCLFIATNEDSNLPNPSDIIIPGTGCIVASVKLALGREPLVLGKPTSLMIDLMVKTHGLDLSRCFMIGDRLNTDIAMANNCGIDSLLVHTGYSHIRDLDSGGADKSATPTYYAESVADLYEFIADL